MFRESHSYSTVWPPHLDHIMNYIATLSLSNISPATIKLNIAAIAFQCKMFNVEDITQCFLIRKMMTGINRADKHIDNRLPVTLDILKKVVDGVYIVCTSNYESTLFAAIFTLAFFGFLRVGELVPNSAIDKGHALLFSNIDIYPESHIDMRIPHSKTDQNRNGVVLNIAARNTPICPVKNLTDYIKVRPKVEGVFFIHKNGSHVTRYQFTAVLKKSLQYSGIVSDRYTSHSFRIGAATAAKMSGFDDETIASLGRWKSNCYKQYIRIPSISFI